MPPPRKRPHPRSLDALFGPKPRTVPKQAVKRCARGHRQAEGWRPMMGCRHCGLYDAASEDIRDKRHEQEREEFAARYGVKGPVFIMVEGSTGRVIRFVIPPHLQKRNRRGPRRRRGI